MHQEVDFQWCILTTIFIWTGFVSKGDFIHREKVEKGLFEESVKKKRSSVLGYRFLYVMLVGSNGAFCRHTGDFRDECR